eukprot:6168373-Pyramimonas_sp.AAC.2
MSVGSKGIPYNPVARMYRRWAVSESQTPVRSIPVPPTPARSTAVYQSLMTVTSGIPGRTITAPQLPHSSRRAQTKNTQSATLLATY